MELPEINGSKYYLHWIALIGHFVTKVKKKEIDNKDAIHMIEEVYNRLKNELVIHIQKGPDPIIQNEYTLTIPNQKEQA